MARNDEPTEFQLGTIFGWIRWYMTIAEATNAVSWLKKTATRRDVSAEMARLKALRDRRLLNGENCFEGKIWEGYKNE